MLVLQKQTHKVSSYATLESTSITWKWHRVSYWNEIPFNLMFSESIMPNLLGRGTTEAEWARSGRGLNLQWFSLHLRYFIEGWQRRLHINGIHDERTKVNDSSSAWITYSKECRSIYNGKKHLYNSISPDVGLRLYIVPDNNVLCKRLLKTSTFSVIPSCIWIIHVRLHATNKGDHTSCNPTHHKSFPYSVDLKGCNWTKMKNCTCHIYKRAVTLRFLVPQSNMHVVMLGGAPPWSKIL